MFLKTLTLKGFKSFGDPVTLDLEPGVCVVVGPNGSGKSNIVDAVAWVLGAQAPKAVRSGKMDDVIFAGTAKRPALGRAEVSLTVDNSSGRLPIDFTEVTLTRTLFRSGDSEYAINGVPCRLLDVQELLSDSGVGRTQHVIVSQGNLDAVLNSRPEDRRSIIEEAAGVLKHRKRRERSLRRLDATEASLLRAQDLLREVRRQIKPLERQADAARRHDGVAAELRALRIHLAGRDLSGLAQRLASATRAAADLAAAEADTRQALARLDADVLAAEAELSGVAALLGAEHLADDLARAEGLRERCRGVAAVVAERTRSVERNRQQAVDAGLVASLEAEAAHLADELAAVEQAAGTLVPELDRLTESEFVVAEERDHFEVTWGGTNGPARPGPAPGAPALLTAAEVRGELSALRQGIDRARAEKARVEARRAALAARAERLAADADRLAATLARTTTDEPVLHDALVEAMALTAAREKALTRAEAAAAAAEAERHRWDARAEALGQALHEARARAGAERLAGVEGVVGTLLELVDVDAGWEDAVEAACGEAVAAVVVDGSNAARRALGALSDRSVGGAVVALPDPGASVTLPWRPELPGVEPVGRHVRSRLPGVDALLDALLADAVCVAGSWQEALDLALDRTDLVVVTRAGDRFAATSWRTGAGGTGATGAALDEARARSEAAAAEARDAAAARDGARTALAAARAGEVAAQQRRQAAAAQKAAAASALERVDVERRDVTAEAGALAADGVEVSGRLEREAARVAELEELLPGLEAEEARGQERELARRAARGRLDERSRAVAALRTDLEVRAAALQERRSLLTRRQAEVEQRLSHNQAERERAESRRSRLEAESRALARFATLVERSRADVDRVLAGLRDRRARQNAATRAAGERLDGLRRERHAAERRLTEVGERSRRVGLDEAETRMRLEAAVEALRRDHEVEPDAAVAAPLPELPPGTSADSRVRELDRELRLMGPVNPLALEELRDRTERSAFLEKELDDVKATRRELTKVIRAIDREIVDVFAAAFGDVSDAFTALFATLFPAGAGRLRLTAPDDLLDTGIEIEARPAGKNVKSLSLLSGGERSLVALAFLFAVFRSRPSPFYLMDEVEAALDDVNLHRFLSLVGEFRSDAQLLIVTHQKRTMEAADCLYGVTMQAGGSSKVVSEKVTAGT
jgi:chromosome segregation protein